MCIRTDSNPNELCNRVINTRPPGDFGTRHFDARTFERGARSHKRPDSQHPVKNGFPIDPRNYYLFDSLNYLRGGTHHTTKAAKLHHGQPSVNYSNEPTLMGAKALRGTCSTPLLNKHTHRKNSASDRRFAKYIEPMYAQSVA